MLRVIGVGTLLAIFPGALSVYPISLVVPFSGKVSHWKYSPDRSSRRICLRGLFLSFTKNFKNFSCFLESVPSSLPEVLIYIRGAFFFPLYSRSHVLVFRDIDNLVWAQLFTYVDGEKNAEWGLKTSFLHAATVFLLATLLFYYRQFSTRRWQHWLFVCILVVDLLVAGKRINFYAPEDFFTDVPDIVPIIRSAIDDGRLFRPKVPPNFVLQTPSDEAMWLSRWNLEMLSEYSGYFYHVPIIFHSDANNLGQSYIIRLAHILEELPWSRKLPILSAGAVTLILTSEKLLLSEIEFIQEIPNRSNLRLYLYRNTRAAPRIGFVTNWDVVHSDDDALKKLLASNFNPRRQAILQADHRREFQAIVRTPHERSATSGDNEGDMVKINKLHATNHSSSFSISTAQDGYLVFSEPFYPGWHVSVDGESVPILRANLAFSAIFLSAGEHVIERWYRPDSLLIGILISLFFCCLLGFVTYKAWW